MLSFCTGLNCSADCCDEHACGSSNSSSESVCKWVGDEEITEPCSKIIDGGNETGNRFGWFMKRFYEAGMDVDGCHDSCRIIQVRQING